MLWTNLDLYNPWSELTRMRDLMNSVFSNVQNSTSQEYPLINVWTNTDDVVLTADLPGVDPGRRRAEDVQVQGQRGRPVGCTQ